MKRTLYCVIEVDQTDRDYTIHDYAGAFQAMLRPIKSADDPWMLKDVVVYDNLAFLNEDHLLTGALEAGA